jgi:phage FluMu protein Com
MRPREEINRRKNLYLTIIGVGFAAMFILAFLEKYIPSDFFKPISYSAIGSFIVGNLLLYIGIRCPKCKAIIGYAIVFSLEKVERCPRCKINYDENM